MASHGRMRGTGSQSLLAVGCLFLIFIESMAWQNAYSDRFSYVYISRRRSLSLGWTWLGFHNRFEVLSLRHLLLFSTGRSFFVAACTIS
jgi:hypothetical protein